MTHGVDYTVGSVRHTAYFARVRLIVDINGMPILAYNWCRKCIVYKYWGKLANDLSFINVLYTWPCDIIHIYMPTNMRVAVSTFHNKYLIWKRWISQVFSIQFMCKIKSILSIIHYYDVIMGAMASEISSLILQSSIQAQIKEHIKALRHWPLCGEFTGNRWIPRTNGQ